MSIERSEISTLLVTSNDNLDKAYFNLKNKIKDAKISETKRTSLLDYAESCYVNRSIELLGGLNNESVKERIANGKK